MPTDTTDLTIALDGAERLALADLAIKELQEDDEFARGVILERLGHLPAVYAAEPVPSAGELKDPREQLRLRYRPRDVQLLFVGESKPASGTFFYQADSHLYRAVREACLRSYGD